MLEKSNLKKFEDIILTYEEIERKISDPEIISKIDIYQEYLKKHADLQEIVQIYLAYKKYQTQLSEAKELLSDPDLKEMAQEEIKTLEKEIENKENALLEYLIPKDPEDNKNAIIEIRAGTGGEEAALFAYDLFRMYSRFAETKHWKMEILSQTQASQGGIKEIIFSISGNEVYSKLKFESGTHRVQRVPVTESSGRIHTSAATVAVLPEAEEIDVKIDLKDLRIDTYRSSGAGGQHVNKTSSAIRITHLPTNIVVACQDERSQFQNKDKAMRMLRAKLYEAQLEEQRKNKANERKLQIGSGDRSEKIRTYNYPQSRLTDHRINLTLYNLPEILNGDLEPTLNELIAHDKMERMKSL